MKKIITYLLIAASTVLNAKDGFRILESDAYSATIEYTFNDLSKKSISINNKTYFKLSSDYAVPVLNTGDPEVLRSSISLALPENCVPKMEILSVNFTDETNFNVIPSKGSLKRNIDPSQIPYTFGKLYTQDQFYPASEAAFNKAYNLRGQNAISLSVFPVRVNALTGQAKLYSKIIFKVSYYNAKGKKLALSAPDYTSLEEMEMFSERFLNLTSAKGAKTAYTQMSEYGSMLVIADPGFTTQMQPFVDWKNQKGIRTTMVTTAATGTTGTTVKAYIQNYYNANPGLLYVLLVGDHQQINAYNAGVAGSETKWSDTYYGLLTGNDHYPELMLGRFSASTASEVTTMVDRTLEYEKTPLAGAWLGKGIGIGSNEGYGIGDEGEADWQHIRKIGNKLVTDGYSYYHEFYDSTHAGNDAPGNPNAAMVSATVNAGASIFFYCGHGSQNGCVTSNYGIANVNVATNNGMYPFSLQVACNNGTFHNGTCFCEAFMRARNNNGPTGAINTCGSTILMAWAEPMDTQDEIGDIISNQYNNNKKYTMGGLFYNGQMHMLDMYPSSTGEEVMETWLMIGDPSCMLRTRSFSNATATYPNCINSGATSATVNAVSGAGKYACISQNNQIIGTSLLNGGTTNIAFTSTFNPSIPLLLTVTEFNKVPLTGTIGVCLQTNINSITLENANIYTATIFKDEISIFYAGTQTALKAEVMDMQGRKVLGGEMINSRESVTRFNTTSLSTGLYLMKVSNSNGETIKVQKLIKVD